MDYVVTLRALLRHVEALQDDRPVLSGWRRLGSIVRLLIVADDALDGADRERRALLAADGQSDGAQRHFRISIMSQRRLRALAHAAAGDQLVRHHDDGDDQQHVQQTAGGDRGRKAKDPKYQQYDSNGV